MTFIKKQRGGRREGSGQPMKYGEETVVVTFRFPKSKSDKIKKLVRKELEKYIVKP